VLLRLARCPFLNYSCFTRLQVVPLAAPVTGPVTPDSPVVPQPTEPSLGTAVTGMTLPNLPAAPSHTQACGAGGEQGMGPMDGVPR
jgi:hypothetical protein